LIKEDGLHAFLESIRRPLGLGMYTSDESGGRVMLESQVTVVGNHDDAGKTGTLTSGFSSTNHYLNPTKKYSVILSTNNTAKHIRGRFLERRLPNLRAPAMGCQIESRQSGLNASNVIIVGNHVLSGKTAVLPAKLGNMDHHLDPTMEYEVAVKGGNKEQGSQVHSILGRHLKRVVPWWLSTLLKPPVPEGSIEPTQFALKPIPNDQVVRQGSQFVATRTVTARTWVKSKVRCDAQFF
jgi:hypothetical protein